MTLYNISRKTVIASAPLRARTLWARTRGMIGRKFLTFDALIFERCSAIHTVFMTQRIDVLFIGRENRILKTVESLAPWIPWCACRGGLTVIELPAGTIARSRTAPGDYIDLDAECVEEIARTAREYGLDIPEDFSLITLGRSSRESELDFTTINSRRDRVAHYAVRLVKEHFEQVKNAPTHYIITPEIHFGKTVKNINVPQLGKAGK